MALRAERTARDARAQSLDQFFTGPALSFGAGLFHSCAGYCPTHSHPAIEIVYHVSGEGFTRVHDEEIAFVPGSVVIYPPYVQHDQTMKREGIDACILIAVDRRLPRELQSCIALEPLEDASLKTEIMDLSKLSTEQSALGRATLAHRATAVLGRLVALAPKHPTRAPTSSVDKYLERAQRYIGDNYQRLQSVEQVASHVGVSADYLRHLFKRAAGTTVIGYLTSVRLARAKALLRYSDLPIKTVAAHAGFGNERYFSEVFRKHEGQSPGEYRRA